MDTHDALPPTVVDAGVPRLQGSIWVTSDALLELEQRVQIDAALMNWRTMDVSDSVTQQQRQQQQQRRWHSHAKPLQM